MTHEHNHEHCGGGCCGSCGCQEATLAPQEDTFLRELAQIAFLPVAQFCMKSTKSDHFESVALAPVFLTGTSDTMEQAREVGETLLSLEAKGLISIDYDEPLEGFDYGMYKRSDLYVLFLETVEEAKGREDFLFDEGVLECGSIALTEQGNQAVRKL